MTAAHAYTDDDVATVRAWPLDPVLFVRQVFGAEPDAWQADVLRALLVSPRIAMSACKGPGKSTLLAWCAWWILACHTDAQGIALSITADNLKDGLWKELAVWYAKSPFLQRFFTLNAERIVSNERPKTWFLSARSFPASADGESQANTLAGLHGEVVFILLDECGDMAPGVVSAAKGIFYTVGQRAWLIAAGNPTTQEGALYWITTTDAAQWHVEHITGDPDDPKRSPRIDADMARAEIAALGRDNPWVMVNILGLFPPAGARQLISANDVTAAMARDMPALTYLSDARVWGLDPARSEKSGADEAALARRQGLLCRRFSVWRGKDGTELGDIVAYMVNEAVKEGEGPDAVFVDVGGVGSSAYDRLVHLGFEDIVHPVDFGGGASQERYRDKRTEMWAEMADWLSKRPACLPNDPVLRSELPAPRYDFRVISKATKFILESKDEMKKRGVRSPNRADALALTFAAPVAPKSREAREQENGGRAHQAHTEYDPLERYERGVSSARGNYDPLRGF